MARGKDRLLAAKGEKKFEAVSSETLDEPLAELKKERPLAARRNKIAQAAASIETTNDDNSSDTPKKIEVPKKTIDEINQEIEENTKKFDADMLAKPKEEPLQSEIVKKKEGRRENVMATGTMMGVVRLLLLLVVGACIGYRSAVSPGSRVERINLLQNPISQLNTDDESLAQQALLNKISGSTSSSDTGASDGTGVGLVPWILGYGEGLLEGGFYGASIIWTVSGMLKSPLEKKFGTRSPNSSGVIALLLSIYNHGFQRIFESILNAFAEIVFYMLVIMVSGAFFSHLFLVQKNEGQLEAAGVNEL